MLNQQNTSTSESQQPGRNYIFYGLLLLALVVVVYIGSVMRDQKPDFYAPGRSAIVNARMHFEESLGFEQALIEQQRMAHNEINMAISQLVKAESLDPADRSRIEQMRVQLLALEKTDRERENTPNELHEQYKTLLNQMDALIKKLENHL